MKTFLFILSIVVIIAIIVLIDIAIINSDMPDWLKYILLKD